MGGFECQNEIKKCPNCRYTLYEKKKYECVKTSHFFCSNCNYSLTEITDEKKNYKIKSKREKNEEADKNYSTYFSGKAFVPFLALVCVIAVYFFFRDPQKEHVDIQKEILNLRKNYPSQKNETWFHILSVFSMSVPSVKSITLLHDHDDKTSNCLKQQLVSLYIRDQNINVKDITYQNVHEIKDYGEVLEYYKPLVKKYGIFVTNLQEVSGNIARIFHSLCDDVSSDVKPAIFIFTLQYDKSMENLEPLKRVSKILRTAWKEVAENEIWPLLSRIVRNVVEIIPEKNISC